MDPVSACRRRPLPPLGGRTAGGLRARTYTGVVKNLQIRGVARRPRAYVRVAGPQAADYLQRMVSNDVVAIDVGTACDALLLTPKARVIAPLRVVRRAPDDFLLLTEHELGEGVFEHLLRFRFAARAEIAPEDRKSTRLNSSHANNSYAVFCLKK